jgi:hypothetical protein
MAAGFQRHGDAAALPRPAGAMGDPLAALVGAAAGTAAIAVAAGAATLLVRRLAGGFQTLPGPATNWLVTAAGIAVVAAADAAVRRGMGSLWTAVLPRVGLLLGLLALVAGGDNGSAGIAGLAAVALAATVAVVPLPRAGTGPRWRTTSRQLRPPGNPRRSRARAEELPVPEPSSTVHQAVVRLAADAPAAGLRQRLERFETAAGEDCIVSRVIVSLAAGSRSGHAHIGFCPPFAALPAVAVTTDYDGVEVVVAAAEVVPWGVRIECRLSEPAEEPLEIPVDVVAHLGGP